MLANSWCRPAVSAKAKLVVPFHDLNEKRNWNWKKETGNLDYFILYTLWFILYFIHSTLFVEGFFEAITSAFFPSKLWRIKPFLSIDNCIFCLASLDDTKDEQPCASAPYFTLSGPKSGNLSRTDLNYVDRAKERVL